MSIGDKHAFLRFKGDGGDAKIYLGLLAFSYISHGDEHTSDLWIAQHIYTGTLHINPSAILVADSILDCMGLTSMFHQITLGIGYDIHIIRMDKNRTWATDQFFR